jgi:tetratricopeptide (TPR) repeat protein
LDTLFIYGVFDRIGVDKEYIKVHHAISDYILRAKMDLPIKLKQKLRKEIETIISTKSEFPDVSEILVTIRSLIEDGNKIPEKYFIPSVALRSIVEYYYDKQYGQVYELAERMLENFRKYDETIVREIRYWYCMALARKTNEIFFEHLNYFDGVDYNFLLGFYRRIEKKYPEAQRLFLRALEFDSESQKARRELVDVLLRLGKYSQAVEWAKKNYEKKKLNAFHIQAYFVCLLRKSSWSPSEKSIIDELMAGIQKSHDFKAKEIYEVMVGEYEYYIKNNLDEAVRLLTDAKEKSHFKSYPIKALSEIYKRRGLLDKEKLYNNMIVDDQDDMDE